jgi:acetyl esterase
MTLDVESLRTVAEARASQRPRGPAIAATTDLPVPDTTVQARMYAPADGDRPLLVFLHGGMWILGNLDTHDRFCRQLAHRAGVSVLAVDYRRAPEHPWPAAVDDAITAFQWAIANLAPVVAIGGDSAGGCLAALACLRLRDEHRPMPTAQILICPNTDLTGTLAAASPHATGSGLDAADVRLAAAMWVPDPAIRASGNASPLHAEHLHGLPPTLIVTAEHDPLRDEGDAFAARLAHAGVPLTHRCEPQLPHGFIQGMDLESTAAASATARLFADVAQLIGPRPLPHHSSGRRSERTGA